MLYYYLLIHIVVTTLILNGAAYGEGPVASWFAYGEDYYEEVMFDNLPRPTVRPREVRTNPAPVSISTPMPRLVSTPTPETIPDPTPAPEAYPDPTPVPEASPDPTPTPETYPDPTPTPDPSPDPIPTPETSPIPTPTPETSPVPTPTPTPIPTHTPTPGGGGNDISYDQYAVLTGSGLDWTFRMVGYDTPTLNLVIADITDNHGINIYFEQSGGTVIIDGHNIELTGRQGSGMIPAMIRILTAGGSQGSMSIPTIFVGETRIDILDSLQLTLESDNIVITGGYNRIFGQLMPRSLEIWGGTVVILDLDGVFGSPTTIYVWEGSEVTIWPNVNVPSGRYRWVDGAWVR